MPRDQPWTPTTISGEQMSRVRDLVCDHRENWEQWETGQAEPRIEPLLQTGDGEGLKDWLLIELLRADAACRLRKQMPSIYRFESSYRASFPAQKKVVAHAFSCANKWFAGYEVGNFGIVKRVAKGGMGQVYKAWQTNLEREVAIKRIFKKFLRTRRSIERFQQEGKAQGRVGTHENIVQVFDTLEAEGHQLIAMDFVDGRDLNVIVEEEGPLPVNQAVNLILQAASGLGHAHGHGVVHRDVKPSNLLLAHKGTLKVSDFGLASIQSSIGERPKRITRTDDRFGTPGFVAPEQLASSKHVDHRVDIYGLGWTFLFILTGVQPSYAELAECRNNLPDNVVVTIERMVAEAPRDRPSSMEEVAALLTSLAPSYGKVTSFSKPDSPKIQRRINRYRIKSLHRWPYEEVIEAGKVALSEPIEIGGSIDDKFRIYQDGQDRFVEWGLVPWNLSESKPETQREKWIQIQFTVFRMRDSSGHEALAPFVKQVQADRESLSKELSLTAIEFGTWNDPFFKWHELATPTTVPCRVLFCSKPNELPHINEGTIPAEIDYDHVEVTFYEYRLHVEKPTHEEVLAKQNAFYNWFDGMFRTGELRPAQALIDTVADTNTPFLDPKDLEALVDRWRRRPASCKGKTIRGAFTVLGTGPADSRCAELVGVDLHDSLSACLQVDGVDVTFIHALAYGEIAEFLEGREESSTFQAALRGFGGYTWVQDYPNLETGEHPREARAGLLIVEIRDGDYILSCDNRG